MSLTSSVVYVSPLPFSDPELSLVQRAEEQSTAMLALQKELDSLREDSHRSRDREARRVQQDEEELQILRERCERLEDERASAVRALLHSDIAFALNIL